MQERCRRYHVRSPSSGHSTDGGLRHARPALAAPSRRAEQGPGRHCRRLHHGGTHGGWPGARRPAARADRPAARSRVAGHPAGRPCGRRGRTPRRPVPRRRGTRQRWAARDLRPGGTAARWAVAPPPATRRGRLAGRLQHRSRPARQPCRGCAVAGGARGRPVRGPDAAAGRAGDADHGGRGGAGGPPERGSPPLRPSRRRGPGRGRRRRWTGRARARHVGGRPGRPDVPVRAAQHPRRPNPGVARLARAAQRATRGGRSR